VVSFTPLPLYPLYPLDRRLGEPQRRSGQHREMKIIYNPRWYNNIKMDFIRIAYEGSYWFTMIQSMARRPVLVNREIKDFKFFCEEC
jgi:hypothetical protein